MKCCSTILVPSDLLVLFIFHLFGSAGSWLQCVGSSSLTRNWTWTRCIASTVLATGPPEKSLDHLVLNLSLKSLNLVDMACFLTVQKWHVSLYVHRVVTSHAIMVLVASPSMARNLMMRISFWSIQVLASCPWQMLAPTQMVPSFSSALPRLSGWMASMWSLARWKRAWILWKPWSALGPGMARPARRSPLLTVDKSNKFDLCFT